MMMTMMSLGMNLKVKIKVHCFLLLIVCGVSQVLNLLCCICHRVTMHSIFYWALDVMSW